MALVLFDESQREAGASSIERNLYWTRATNELLKCLSSVCYPSIFFYKRGKLDFVKLTHSWLTTSTAPTTKLTKD